MRRLSLSELEPLSELDAVLHDYAEAIVDGNLVRTRAGRARIIGLFEAAERRCSACRRSLLGIVPPCATDAEGGPMDLQSVA